MAQAVIICEIEKLRTILVEEVKGSILVEDLKDPYVIIIMGWIMNEMTLMVSLMREKRLEDGSWRLSCFISEIVKMNRILHYAIEVDDDVDRITSLWRMIMERNERMRDLEVSLHHENECDGEGSGDIVGFEEDVELLLRKINDEEEQQHFVACIRGIAGCGKTTLARQLYMHEDVAHKFDHRVWMSCRGILSEKELLVNFLWVLGNSDKVATQKLCADMECPFLISFVAHKLQGKRYFIVLDDIHGLYSFDHVIESLQNNAEGGSRLLFTSRTGINSSNDHYHHDMIPLDLDKSWHLLLKTMFPNSNKFPKHLERRGKTVLMKHSGGIPLAVKEVAMEWVEKRRRGIGWGEVVESEDLELRASLEAIESSIYQNVARDYKLFYIHLGLFKLGTTIKARRLLQTWIASGALKVSRELDYKHCLTSSIGRTVLEVENKDKDGEMKNCHVGAIIHKLALKKLKEGSEGASNGIVYCDRKGFNSTADHNERLTCVAFNGGGCLDASPSFWKSFEQLRVLEFEGFGLKILPEAIGELIELRYLGLRNNYIPEIPISLGCLKNLEVLDIALNFMVKVPDILWEMNALVHLYMSDISCMKPLKIEALKNLQTLTYISVDDWAYEVSGLQMMTSLRKLGIEKMDESSNVSNLFALMEPLMRLKSLVLRGSCFRRMPSLDGLGILYQLKDLKLEGLITKQPSPEDFPPNLFSLMLVNSCVDEDPMPILEKLPKLNYLKLQNAYTGQEMMISKGGFPHLKHLCIGELWHIRNWQVSQAALTLLNKLEITSCPYLLSLSKEIITMKNLELNIEATMNITR